MPNNFSQLRMESPSRLISGGRDSSLYRKGESSSSEQVRNSARVEQDIRQRLAAIVRRVRPEARVEEQSVQGLIQEIADWVEEKLQGRNDDSTHSFGQVTFKQDEVVASRVDMRFLEMKGQLLEEKEKRLKL